jgi:hypothetical protein
MHLCTILSLVRALFDADGFIHRVCQRASSRFMTFVLCRFVFFKEECVEFNMRWLTEELEIDPDEITLIEDVC